MSYSPSTDVVSDVVDLDRAQCLQLVSTQTLGRLVTSYHDRADIFPMNFSLSDGCIMLRSAPGTKLMHITRSPGVLFEVDHARGATAWSVVARGRARRLAFDTEIEDSGVLQLVAEHPSPKYNYVAIDVDHWSGRWFRRRVTHAPLDDEVES